MLQKGLLPAPLTGPDYILRRFIDLGSLEQVLGAVFIMTGEAVLQVIQRSELRKSERRSSRGCLGLAVCPSSSRFTC